MKRVACLLVVALFCAGTTAAETVTITPDMDEFAIQEALILGESGTVFQFEAGTYKLTQGLSVDTGNVILRGRGMDKTIFSFKDQEAGGQGLYITGDDVTLEDFALEDAKGNAHKSNDANNHVIRRVRAEWTGGPKDTNGAYGFYPVSSKNVLIDGCVAIGASDAGIYVGQTENVIVRNSRAEYNVAGIEIENCHHADVYDNVATNNTGGLLVFDLPGLPVQHGQYVRLFRNKVYNNDTPNFAPAGNIVANVAQGTGIMIMANSKVEVFQNEIRDHRTYNLVICNYKSMGIEITDPKYYPYPEDIYVHGNTFGKSGFAPSGKFGALIGLVTGVPVPDVVWDGWVNSEKVAAGTLPANANILIGDNKKEEGELTFINIDAENALKDPLTAKISRDLAPHKGTITPLKPVSLGGIEG